MSDALKIWGTDYTGVTGFKAVNNSSQLVTYIKPEGTKVITSNGSNFDVGQFATATISVPVNNVQVDSDGSIILPPLITTGMTFQNIVDSSLVGDVVVTSTKVNGDVLIRPNLFKDNVGISTLSITASDIFGIEGSAFENCTGLKYAYSNKLWWAASNSFKGCTNLEYVVNLFAALSSSFQGCSKLKGVDMTYKAGNEGIRQTSAFSGCAQLSTLVLRGTGIMQLANVNNFSNTPFASGGAGGTIYIPESLYEHLGDGTASDYKAATNWSTIDGYGTITWEKIEGSQYENYYVDGSPAITSVSVVYTQSKTVFVTDSLDSLKSDLVVTVTYADSSTSVLSANQYSLFGNLVEGTSTITAVYATSVIAFNMNFNVTVTDWDIVWDSSVGNPTSNGWTSSSGSMSGNYWVVPASNSTTNIRRTTDFTAADGVMELVVKWPTLPTNGQHYLNLPSLRYTVTENTIRFTTDTSDTTVLVYTGVPENVDVTLRVVYSATNGCSLYLDGVLVHTFNEALPYDTTRFLLAVVSSNADMYLKNIRLKSTV